MGDKARAAAKNRVKSLYVVIDHRGDLYAVLTNRSKAQTDIAYARVALRGAHSVETLKKFRIVRYVPEAAS